MTATASPAAPTGLRRIRTAVVLALGLLLTLVLAGQAKAAEFGFAAEPAPPGLAANCQAGTGTERLKVTCTFADARNAALSVGPNVNHADVRAVGHRGGHPSSGSYTRATGAPGGAGADVSGRINFAAGSALFVNVGGLEGPQGDPGSAENGWHQSSPAYNSPWSFGGGAPAGVCALAECAWYHQNGAGGGASDVRTVDSAQPGTLESRLIVGAGGGGGGGVRVDPATSSGAGGNAGEPGQTGGENDSAAGGGGAATASAGGSAGYTAPVPTWQDMSGYGGTLGNGGPGGKAMNLSHDTGGGGGGGGGGGLYGGGGGGGVA